MNHCTAGYSQHFSPQCAADWRIRIRHEEMQYFSFEPLCSMQDADVLMDARRVHGARAQDAGITEWQGIRGRILASLGWDWVRLSDGQVLALATLPPRSNLRMIDEKGYDIEDLSAAPVIWQFITNLHWQSRVCFGDLWSGTFWTPPQVRLQ